jgi:hypothetical protein
MITLVFCVYGVIVIGTIIHTLLNRHQDTKPVFHVSSAESKNGGAMIPGAGEDGERLARASLEKIDGPQKW